MILIPLAIFVPIALLRSESYSAKHFSGPCRANGHEAAKGIISIMVAVSLRQSGGPKTIGNLHKFVRVGALVSTRADRRGHGIDVHGAVAVDFAREVTASTRCRVE